MRKTGKKLRKEEVQGILFANIPFVGFCLFGMIPLLLSLYLCFHSFKGLRLNTAKPVGFANFQEIFADEMFWQSLNNTWFVVLVTVVSLIISLVVSALIATNVRGAKGFKAVYFVPYVCSMVAITFMWKWIYDYNYGVLNTTLMNWGWIKEPISWLGSESYYRTAMLILLVWSSTGYNIILLTAALLAVPKHLQEAAELDGAGEIKRFFKITLPLISPTVFYLLIMGMIGSMQEFTRFQIMTPDGGPAYQGMTVVFYLYRQLFNASGGSDLGVASAMGWVIALFITLITILNFRLQRKWVNYD